MYALIVLKTPPFFPILALCAAALFCRAASAEEFPQVLKASRSGTGLLMQDYKGDIYRMTDSNRICRLLPNYQGKQAEIIHFAAKPDGTTTAFLVEIDNQLVVSIVRGDAREHYSVPAEIGFLQGKHTCMSVSDDVVVFVGDDKIAVLNSGKWQTRPLEWAKSIPTWGAASFLRETFALGPKVLLSYNGGEWGAGVATLDVHNGHCSILLEERLQGILSATVSGDKFWAFKGSELFEIDSKGQSSVHDCKSTQPNSPAVVCSDNSDKAYLVCADGAVYEIVPTGFKFISKMTLAKKSAQAQVGIAQPPVSVRWALISGASLTLQMTSEEIEVLNLQTKQCTEPSWSAKNSSTLDL